MKKRQIKALDEAGAGAWMMHELPVTENILEIALRHANEAGASRVTDIQLVVGDLSSFVDDSIQFYWDMLSEGTMAAGAVLHFRRLPITLHCLNCDHRYEPSSEDFACPQCSSERIEIDQGEEFYIDSIEIERDQGRRHEDGRDD